jgi:hypothetical protein
MADTWDSGTFDKIGKGECFNKSGFYTLPVDGYYWYHLINIRHRNGAGDGPKYGVQIRKQFDTFSAMELRSQNNGSWSGWEHIQRSFTIFENSSGASSATLSLDASHLRYMEIFYSHNYGAYGFKSVRVENPNGKRVTLDLIEGQGAYIVMYTGHIIINGQSVTFTSGDGLSIHGSNFTLGGFAGSNEMKIHKIIGYL